MEATHALITISLAADPAGGYRAVVHGGVDGGAAFELHGRDLLALTSMVAGEANRRVLDALGKLEHPAEEARTIS